MKSKTLENICKDKRIGFATSKGYLGILDMDGRNPTGAPALYADVNANKLDGRNGSLYYSDENGIHIFGNESIVKYKNITAFRVDDNGDIYFGIKTGNKARLKRLYKGHNNEKNEVKDSNFNDLYCISAIDIFKPKEREGWKLRVFANYWEEWVDSPWSDDLSGYVSKGFIHLEDHWLKHIAGIKDMRIIDDDIFLLRDYSYNIQSYKLVHHNDSSYIYSFIRRISMKDPSSVKFYSKDENRSDLTSLDLFNDQLIVSSYDEIRSVDNILCQIDSKELGHIISVAGF